MSQHKEAREHEPVKRGCGLCGNIIWMENNGGEMFSFLVGVEMETEKVRDGG